MATTTSSSEVSVQELSVEALRQNDKKFPPPESILGKSNSICAAVANANKQKRQANCLHRQQKGDANLTAARNWRTWDTVAETSIAAKH